MAGWKLGSLVRFAGLGLALTASCGTGVAQTASIDASGLLDCTAAGAIDLPSNAVFGDGSEPSSALVGQGYAGGQGPGLFVAARDAFRVYLNGELVVASTASRAPTFVPLSLLPGDNALSVVVAAKRGTPAALVQLDELDQSYPSDATWRASTAPTAGYALPDYDDSSWLAARDLGVLGTLPGCDPTSFPSDSSAHWIAPASGSGSTAVFRKVISLAAVGYGAGTTGGYGQAATVVSTWDDLQSAATDPDAAALILIPEGSYDFRTAARNQAACGVACTSDPSKSLYTVLVSGQTCATALVTRTRNERTLELGSNKTIVGLGRGAQIRGVGLDLGSSHNLILRNIALYDVNPSLIQAGGALTLTQASHVWVDHVTAKWISDGFADVNTGSQKITFSWLHFDGVNDNECDGSHTRAADVAGANVTFHHCFFDHVETHSPSVHDSTSLVHLFDNLLSDNASYAVESACGASVLLEANTFQRVATPTERATCPDNTSLGLINAPAGSNYYGDDVGPNHGGDGKEPHDNVAKPTYAYTLGVPQDEWLTILTPRAGAGGQWSQPLSLD